MDNKGRSLKLSDYLREYEAREGWAPTRQTVLNWIRAGVLVGEQIGKPSQNGKRGGPWVVYPDAKPPIKQDVDDIIAEFDVEALNYVHGQTT